MTEEDLPGKIIKMTYDDAGRKVSVEINRKGDIVNFEYTYDVRDRVASKTTPWETLTYPLRTGSGKIDILTTTNGYNVDYNYYASDGLLWQRVDNGKTTTYTYDSVKNLDTITYPNWVVIDYDYNSVNKLEKYL